MSQIDPPTHAIKQITKELLVCLAQAETSLEAARTKLSQIPDFTPVSAFERIDRNQNGEVNAEDLIRFMKDNGVFHIETHEMQHLINYFDGNNTKTLEPDELGQIFLPCENNELRNSACKRNIGEIGPEQRLPSNNEFLMSKIIGEEIELVREIEHIKNALLKEPEYHPYAIFREIDQDGDNRISKEEIGNFLRKTGFHANE